jgi:alanine racemase
MSRGARALIDCDSLRHNLGRVHEAAPDSRVMAVIKAGGYGHGLARVAAALDGADAFAVACVEEAATLREHGVTRRIVLLEGVFAESELVYAAEQQLDMVVHTEEQLQLLERTSLRRPLRAWLKVDTGMHRLGFPPGQAARLWTRLDDCAAVGRTPGLMTHLANADVPGHAATDAQLQLFAQAAEGLPAERSVANSGAVLTLPAAHYHWVRPGIMLYGAAPFPDQTGVDLGLRPVMTLSTRLIAVNRHRRGDAIGYGGAWTCPEDMAVGVAAIGYGDGYPRNARNGTPVLVNGRRAPLVGRVSMDMICIDLRGHPEAAVGDPVVLWGEGLPVEEVARHAGTIGYELLCRVTRRVRFVEV